MIESDKKLYVSPLIKVVEFKVELGSASSSGFNSLGVQPQRLSVGMTDYFPHSLDREEDNGGIADYNSVHWNW